MPRTIPLISGEYATPLSQLYNWTARNDRIEAENIANAYRQAEEASRYQLAADAAAREDARYRNQQRWSMAFAVANRAAQDRAAAQEAFRFGVNTQLQREGLVAQKDYWNRSLADAADVRAESALQRLSLQHQQELKEKESNSTAAAQALASNADAPRSVFDASLSNVPAALQAALREQRNAVERKAIEDYQSWNRQLEPINARLRDYYRTYTKEKSKDAFDVWLDKKIGTDADFRKALGTYMSVAKQVYDPTNGVQLRLVRPNPEDLYKPAPFVAQGEQPVPPDYGPPAPSSFQPGYTPDERGEPLAGSPFVPTSAPAAMTVGDMMRESGSRARNPFPNAAWGGPLPRVNVFGAGGGFEGAPAALPFPSPTVTASAATPTPAYAPPVMATNSAARILGPASWSRTNYPAVTPRFTFSAPTGAPVNRFLTPSAIPVEDRAVMPPQFGPAPAIDVPLAATSPRYMAYRDPRIMAQERAQRDYLDRIEAERRRIASGGMFFNPSTGEVTGSRFPSSQYSLLPSGSYSFR